MGQIISIFDNLDFSRKGSLGVNLAAALSIQSKEGVAFVDMTLSGGGNIEQISGFKAEKNIIDLTAVMERANENIIKGYIERHSSGVSFIEGVDMDSLRNVSPENLAETLKLVSRAFSFVVLILPSSFDDYFKAVCGASNLSIVSIYPQMISLLDCRKFLEKLASWHLPLALAKGIINRTSAKTSLEKKKIENYLGINVLSEIPYDADMVVSSINRGTIDVMADPHSEFSVSIKNLAQKLLNNELYVDIDSSRVSQKGVASKIVEQPGKLDFDKIKQRIHRELVKELGAKNIDIKDFSDAKNSSAIRGTTLRTIQEILSREDAALTRERREQLAGEVLDEALGLGCLEKLLKDKEVTEIMVNGPESIYVERKGKLYLTDERFLSGEQLMTVIDRIVSPIGRRVDESSPIVDARLADGSRVNAIIHPLSLVGPVLTIRKFSEKKLTVEDLIGFGALCPQMGQFLKVCVQLRKNIIVSGGTGSGKTTLLNVISSFIPEDERIVTIEDSAELKLPQKHVVRLESRPPSIEGKGEIPIRRLVINALRMRPDRIVVGECRGGETLDMLQAMNTGHDGSMTTIHANNPRDGISRITTMVIMAGTDLPEKAIREQISSAVNIIVQLSRLSDGSRKMVEICEVNGIKNDAIVMTPLFKYEQTGVKDGKVMGRYVALGCEPSFIKEAETHGMEIDRSIFKEGELK